MNSKEGTGTQPYICMGSHSSTAPFFFQRVGNLRECQLSLMALYILISQYTKPLGNGSAEPIVFTVFANQKATGRSFWHIH